MAPTIVVNIPIVSIKGLGKYWLVTDRGISSVHWVKVVFDATSSLVSIFSIMSWIKRALSKVSHHKICIEKGTAMLDIWNHLATLSNSHWLAF